MDRIEFKKTVVRHIRERGISMLQLAEGIQISYSVLMNRLNGFRPLTHEYAKKIMDFIRKKEIE